MRRGIAISLAAAFALSACAQAQSGPALASAPAQPCDVKSLDSPPARAWWAEERWRYASDADAAAAYAAIALPLKTDSPSPWPDWLAPAPPPSTPAPPVPRVAAAVPEATLPVGIRFQMAMGPAKDQPDTWPGGFGTFDYIRSVADVRDHLAVREDWKPVVARVVTYEVIQPLPVRFGPIGAQIDPVSCRLLPGRWSQFQMLVPGKDRMNYLKPIADRPIH